MSVLKLCGMLLVLLFSAGLGVYSAGRLTVRIKTLEGLHDFFHHLENEMRYTAQPFGVLLPAMCTRFRSLPFLEPCCRAVNRGNPFPEAFMRSARAYAFAMCLRQEDLEMLERSCGQLGRTDLNGQLSLCQLLKMRLSQLLSEAKENAEKLGRIYRTLGLMGGAALVLLVL